MISVINFVYCLNVIRKVNPDRTETVDASGILPVLLPESIPGNFSFSIVFTVLGINPKQLNNVQIQFKKDNVIVADSGIISIAPIDKLEKNSLPDDYVGLNMSMDFRNIVFKKTGIYNTLIFINSKEIASEPIYVQGKC